jgi:hypothetical protein
MRILIPREYYTGVAETFSQEHAVKYVVEHPRWFATFSMGEALEDDWLGIAPSDFDILSEFMTMTENAFAEAMRARNARTQPPALLDFDESVSEYKQTFCGMAYWPNNRSPLNVGKTLANHTISVN